MKYQQKNNMKNHLIEMNHFSKLEKVPISESLLSQLNMTSGNISNTENSENPETTPNLASKTSNQIVNNNNEPVSPSTSISPSNTNNSRKQKRKRNITTDMGGPNKKFKESENDVEIIYNPPNLNQFNQFECPECNIPFDNEQLKKDHYINNHLSSKVSRAHDGSLEVNIKKELIAMGSLELPQRHQVKLDYKD